MTVFLTILYQGIRCYVCNSSSILNQNTNCETPLHHLLPTECPNTCEYCDYFKINAHTLGFGKRNWPFCYQCFIWLGCMFASLLLDFGTVYRGCSENSSWLRQSVAFEKTIANIVTLSYRSCDTDLCNGDYWDRSSLLRNKQFTSESHPIETSCIVLVIRSKCENYFRF